MATMVGKFLGIIVIVTSREILSSLSNRSRLFAWRTFFNIISFIKTTEFAISMPFNRFTCRRRGAVLVLIARNTAVTPLSLALTFAR